MELFPQRGSISHDQRKQTPNQRHVHGQRLAVRSPRVGIIRDGGWGSEAPEVRVLGKPRQIVSVVFEAAVEPDVGPCCARPDYQAAYGASLGEDFKELSWG